MTSDSLPPELTAPAIQRDVQRLLGRCMVRIQQYEHTLKVLLAHHEISGPVDTLADQAAQRAQKLSGQTLGQLANLLFGSFVVPEGFERELLPEDNTPTDRASFARGFRMTMQSEQLAQTKLAVQELVDLRNELVHHLLARFNLGDEQGCTDAIAYLEDSYLRIDARYQELRGWMWTMHKAAEAMASLVQSEAYLDLLFNGINPDGSFEWSHTGIVRALRTQVQTLAGDNWVALETVKAQMLAHHPDQTPQKYRSGTWQQVLSESGEFDLEYRRESDIAPKKPWVRLRPERPLRSGAKERKPPGRGPMTPLLDQIDGPE
ncbi:hypothetical protein [Acidovorax sp.]|uniref:hypothetical protein n=1 Tax=Acidovorax sp. TaxID=1872122 RepID=UPI00262F971F|nr:hypothetical protein [Acidovorax sp.]